MEEPRLEEILLFRRLDPSERAELEELLEPAQFDAGEAMIQEGGEEESVFVLTSGTVEVHKQVTPGRSETLATMSAPTVVGELGLLTEPKAIASVVAKTPVEAHAMDREEFLELLESGSLAASKVVYEIGRTLAARMAHTDRVVSEVIERIEDRPENVDFEVFRDRMISDWYA
ncbi:Cyclic nucleotide-binding domain [Rubrobacter radiotolerans]|uniref:Cyclic nucleotide-binding domain n=1 Tax=Rubrobacter radiotolerans TaxID=42256 RepID=A0A023WZG1_RUBRA|nr:cyclic nucleotide-binding domain-containing protein [Rubrobacter radiotolerans]AHY45473.1 Cyclic nucleotide-binding domain [Rubrobacter radiotolerans]MDX5892884.1 cyclic nucleotide-binding domain-containing protein [Rubrobacter radiotolerans]SMC02679.1 Cyclic nucleotide-binding domain-containing protein [Rubrobacter radiotolerans DSM 5868]